MTLSVDVAYVDRMTEEYGLLEVEEDAAAGDEWEELDVADTEADQLREEGHIQDSV